MKITVGFAEKTLPEKPKTPGRTQQVDLVRGFLLKCPFLAEGPKLRVLYVLCKSYGGFWEKARV